MLDETEKIEFLLRKISTSYATFRGKARRTRILKDFVWEVVPLVPDLTKLLESCLQVW